MSTRSVVFAIPGDLNTPTGGYVYDRSLLDALGAKGWSTSVLRLGDSFPYPTSEHTSEAAEALARVPEESVLMVDGLALGAMEPSALESVRAPIVALVHHPLAYEGNLDDATHAFFLQRERKNLSLCQHVIVTSPATAELVHTEYNIALTHITVAIPGVKRPTQPRAPQTPPLLLSVGSLIPRKGHDVLIQALASVSDLAWTAIIAGEARDEEYADSVAGLVAHEGLEDRVSLVGSVSAEELERLYSRASVFILATRFEGYGMVFAEAMAHGLPIATCHTGAVPDTIAPGAGLLVPVDDPQALADALRSLLSDSSAMHTMAEASARAGLGLPRWSDTAAIVAAVLNQVLEGRIDR
jgi:glycosyltransferase involved in cell wall biosynthesis